MVLHRHEVPLASFSQRFDAAGTILWGVIAILGVVTCLRVNFSPADVDRMLAELVEMTQEVARTKNLKDSLGTFMAKSHELFRIVSAEITGARGQKKVNLTQTSFAQFRAGLEKRMRFL
jgi:hypothetical protein